MKKQKVLVYLSLILTVLTASVVVFFSIKSGGSSPQTADIATELANNSSLSEQSGNNAGYLVRKPAVAGQFYPSESEELEKELASHLKSAEKIEEAGKLRVLIVPHAGLKYSGKTAAEGYKQIANEKYQRVIIIGINHQSTEEKAAIYPYGEWQTPLGNVKIDYDLAGRLKNGEDIVFNTDEHSSDHSIEMQVLFVKYLLGDDFKLTPIILGKPKNETIEALANKIASVFDDETLLIISTDLSHYPNYEDANRADFKTISGILSGRKRSFEQATSYNYAKQFENLSTSACGYHPVRVGLRVAEIMEFGTLTKIDYTNSGDITGDKDRVVGYAAIGAWQEKLPEMTLSEKAKKEALALARKTLEEYYKNETRMLYEPENNILNKPIGAFVTLTKQGNLRGCVGNFDPDMPLYQVVQEMVINAAVNDQRFTPVSFDELNEIEIEISTLTPLRRIYDWQQIELGRHGVKIVLNNKSGTLLPQVATENKWGLETFLETLCQQKADLKQDCYKDPNAQIFIFETDIF